MNRRLWWAQIVGIVRLEMSKSFAAKRAIPVYLLAMAPVVLFGAHSIAYQLGTVRCSAGEDFMIYAAVFQVFVLRLAIFFGCVAVFMNLFRGEVLEKSLHYYFLAPVRREVLVAGKYAAGLLNASVLFGLGTVFSYLVMAAHVARVRQQPLFAEPAGAHLAAYLGVTLLACAGYGAVFLIMGLVFRNPIAPAVVVLLWESITIFLPAMLKKISVIFYLESLCPLRLPSRGGASAVFAITAEPVPAYLAIPGLLCLTVVALALAGLLIRRMEINYGAE